MEYLLPLDPLPCPRPRIAVRGKFPTAYYPASYQKWKNDAAERLVVLKPEKQFTGPLRVVIGFAAERPKSTKLTHPKSDIDNYMKSLFDALTQAGWWVDDSQVVQVKALKYWAAPGLEGYIRFSIEEITE
jgi:Holliday junction resolvase RusA-like endonuclease